MKIKFSQLKQQVYDTFLSGGMCPENADITADSIVTAEARGVYSHGIKLVPMYLKHMGSGYMKGNPEIKILRESGTTLLIDGDSGIGAVVMTKATNILVEKSKGMGTASMAIVNTGHFGAGAYYVEKAAQQGQIAFLYGNTGRSAVPFGGTGRYLGTNPYSFSAPAGKYGTITLDMATTETAASKLSAAVQDGVQVKLGCGVNADGNPTTDPSEILNGGALCHFGGVKGYGIAFMIDVVAGVLTGAGYKASDISLFGGDHPTVGFFMNLTDIGHIMPEERFIERAEDLINDIKKVRPAPGFNEVCFPGEIENKKKLRALENGIEVHDAAYELFATVAKEYGVICSI